MGDPIDLVKLDGTWRLQYTSAPDVLVLFEAAARLPFFKVYTNQQMLFLILPLSFLFNLRLLQYLGIIFFMNFLQYVPSVN